MSIHFLVAAAVEDLWTQVVPFMSSLFTIGCGEQTGPLPVTGEEQSHGQGLDPSVIIDAFAINMGHVEKELCKPGNLVLYLIQDTWLCADAGCMALCLIQDTVNNALGSKGFGNCI